MLHAVRLPSRCSEPRPRLEHLRVPLPSRSLEPFDASDPPRRRHHRRRCHRLRRRVLPAGAGPVAVGLRDRARSDLCVRLDAARVGRLPRAVHVPREHRDVAVRPRLHPRVRSDHADRDATGADRLGRGWLPVYRAARAGREPRAQRATPAAGRLRRRPAVTGRAESEVSVDARRRSRRRCAHAARWLVRSERPVVGLPAQGGGARRDLCRGARRRGVVRCGRGTIGAARRRFDDRGRGVRQRGRCLVGNGRVAVRHGAAGHADAPLRALLHARLADGATAVRQGRRAARVPVRGPGLLRRRRRRRRATRLQLRRGPRLLRARRVAGGGASLPAARGREMPSHVGRPLRAERARRQRRDRRVDQPPPQSLHGGGLLGARHDARAGRGQGGRGADPAGPLRDDRPHALRLRAGRGDAPYAEEGIL